MMQMEILTPPPAVAPIEASSTDPKLNRLSKIWLKLRFYIPAAALLVLIIVSVLITVRYFLHEHQYEEFVTPPPRTQQTTTVVTAHLTLDSPNSVHFVELLDKAHNDLRLVLQLRLPMVIFTDVHSLEFVIHTRRQIGMENETKVWNISVEELPLYERMEIFHDLTKQQDRADSTLLPAPLTVLLSHAKPHFLSNASEDNPFNTPFFSWISPDYGKGNSSHFPSTNEWNPDVPAGKISLLKMAPANYSLTLYTKEKLYRNNATLVTDDFLAGDSTTIDRFHKVYEAKLVDVVVNDRMIGDPQMILVLLINEMSELFNVVQGEWFTAFHLF